MMTLFISILILFAFIHPNIAVKCRSCDGDDDCMGETCEGDYCVITNVWIAGQSRRPIKGCSRGELWEDDIPDGCIEYKKDNGKSAADCICSTENCNRKVKKMEDVKPGPVTCWCDEDEETNNQCVAGFCEGDYCAHWFNHKTNKAIRGCLSAALPMIRETATEVCELPPMTGVQSLEVNYEDLLMIEQCICSTEKCNSEKPKPAMMYEETKECKWSVNVTPIHGRYGELSYNYKIKNKIQNCNGQYCFTLKVKDKDPEAKASSSLVQGCMTLAKGSTLDLGLNTQGCQEIESENFYARQCLKTDDPPPKATPPKDKNEPAVEEPKQVEEPMADDGSKSKPPPTKSGNDKTKADNGKGSTGGPQIIIVRTTPEPIDLDEGSNTVLVAIFVVIMVIIVIAGVVWKFELHKRIFRARYETVAG